MCGQRPDSRTPAPPAAVLPDPDRPAPRPADRPVRGRCAPSPTGQMHLGNAWSALLAWLDTRSRGGVFVLRTEDLDPARSGAERARRALEDLYWLGIDWDEGPDVGGPHAPYVQSRRGHLYAAALQRLADQGLIYACTCSRADVAAASDAPHGPEGPRYPGTCRSRAVDQQSAAALRWRAPPGMVRFTDRCLGPIAQDVQAEIGDFVVRRADGVMAYQLAVVVDDAAMGITSVVRGNDLALSTPRQLQLYAALGHAPPDFAHVPLVRGPDGRRMAKRHGDIALAALRQKGVAPQTVVGHLAYLAGLLPQPEAVAARDLVRGFDLTAVVRSDVSLNPADLLPARQFRRRRT